VGASISGVGVLDKAVLILTALEEGPADLATLMSRTGLPRATAHRLAAALESHALVERPPGGAYRLGRRVSELGRAAAPARSISLVEAARPVLERLRDDTGESAQLYVRAGDGRTRVCLATAESPQGLRTMVAVGAVLPMDRGSAGKVLTASGPLWAESVEEREPGVASVSAAVVCGGEVVAALSVSGPLGRTSRHPGRRYGRRVTEAAEELAAVLAFTG
jgi:DNA-binding IclR family transcriptional regulator